MWTMLTVERERKGGKEETKTDTTKKFIGQKNHRIELFILTLVKKKNGLRVFFVFTFSFPLSSFFSFSIFISEVIYTKKKLCLWKIE